MAAHAGQARFGDSDGEQQASCREQGTLQHGVSSVGDPLFSRVRDISNIKYPYAQESIF